MALDTTGLISVAEAARRLHRSEEQVRRNLRSGKLRGRRIGNQWFVEEREVEIDLDQPLIPAETIRRLDAVGARLGEKLGSVDVVEVIRKLREEA